MQPSAYLLPLPEWLLRTTIGLVGDNHADSIHPFALFWLPFVSFPKALFLSPNVSPASASRATLGFFELYIMASDTIEQYIVPS